MLSRILQRYRDMKTIAALCTAAEKHANTNGEQEPGAEHFVLAALDLPDGTARKALVKAGIDPDKLRDAIEAQHRDALRGVGVEIAEGSSLNAVSAVPQREGIYKAKGSAETLMRMLAGVARGPREDLVGAHVVGAAMASTHGVVARVLRSAASR